MARYLSGILVAATLLAVCERIAVAADLTSAEKRLKELLGPGTPDPIVLWPDKPPLFLEGAPPEVVDDKPSIQMISMPTITPYLPAKSDQPALAIIICPGGGYGAMDWK